MHTELYCVVMGMGMEAVCAGTDGWGWGQGLAVTVGDGFQVHRDVWRWG